MKSTLLTTLIFTICLSICHAEPVPDTPVLPQKKTTTQEKSTQEKSTQEKSTPEKAKPTDDKASDLTPKSDIIEPLTPPDHFVPLGGLAHLRDPADLDLFTKGKAVGHVRNDPKQEYRRLVQRTIMPTEPRPHYGAVLTFDDQLVGGSRSIGSAITIAKELAPLHARAIFFANVNGLSTTDLKHILKQTKDSEKRLKLCQALFDSKKKNFIATIRTLLKIQSPADSDGNRQFTCEVFNHTAFHQDMTKLKVGSDKFNLCLLGISFIEQCLDEAYLAERPGWKRARYFRFPFLHIPKDPATRSALNEKFTELGLIAAGETQDSKDFDNYSSTKAYRSLAAARNGKRYSISMGRYGKTTHPIALFHTKTWPKIRKGVLKAIREVRSEE